MTFLISGTRTFIKQLCFAVSKERRLRLSTEVRMSIAVVLSFLVATAAAQQTAYPFNDPALAAEKRIDDLLSRMTVDEKIDCLGTQTGVPRLGVKSFGSSEGI